MYSTENDNGRLHVLADVEYTNYLGQPYAHLTCECPEMILPDDAKEVQGTGYWRLCFRRNMQDWRLRDEAGGVLEYVSTYKGILNHDWYDQTAHLYHVGKAYLHQGYAILVPGIGVRPANVQNKITQIETKYQETVKSTQPIVEVKASILPGFDVFNGAIPELTSHLPEEIGEVINRIISPVTQSNLSYY